MSHIKPRTAITHTQLNAVADALEASVTAVDGSQVAHEGLDERAFSLDTTGFTCPWQGPSYKASLPSVYVDQSDDWTTIPLGSGGTGIITIPATSLVTGDFLEIELQGIGSFAHYLNAHPVVAGTAVPDYPIGGGSTEPGELSYHKWHGRIVVEYSLDGGSNWLVFGPDNEGDTPGAQYRCASIYRSGAIGAGFVGQTSGGAHDIATHAWSVWPPAMANTTPTGASDITNVNLGWQRTFYLHNILPLIGGLLGNNIQVRARVRPGMFGTFGSTAIADPLAIIGKCSLQVHVHRKGL